ncbi:Pyruvate dehydrogenase complex repressor [Pseudomonas fluorescens]|jgi:DNA-binding FadR family transcriptional regulator|nr:Pyruvate dehydrogenase complex repressor [Pseudomonas fluorescens]
MIDENTFSGSKTERVARVLLNWIIESDISPGSSLGTEAELLERLHVSRPTLRESLRILESQGILTLRPGPGGGILVSKPSVDMLAYSLSVYLRLNDVPFVEILRARMAIEPVLVRDSARFGSDEDFDEMERSIDRLEKSGGDSEVVYKENRAFHNAIARAASNPVLELFWSTISILASGEGAGLKYTERNLSHIIGAHRRILEACRKRDPEAAHRLMVDHLGELDVLLRTRFKDRLDEPTRITHKESGKLV